MKIRLLSKFLSKEGKSGSTGDGNSPDWIILRRTNGGTRAVVAREFDLETESYLDESEAFPMEGRVCFGESHHVFFSFPDRDDNTPKAGDQFEVRYLDWSFVRLYQASQNDICVDEDARKATERRRSWPSSPSSIRDELDAGDSLLKLT